MEVPIIKRETPQNSYQPLQVNAPPRTPLPEMTGQLNFVNAIDKVARQAKDEADMAMVTDASRKMDEWQAANMFDPQKGYLSQQGQSAIGGSTSLISRFDSDMAQLVKGLGNPEQQLAVTKEINQRRAQLQQAAMAHERAQTSTYFDTVATQKVQSSSNNAALFWNNPEVVEGSIQAAKDAVTHLAEIRGVPVNEADIQKIESNARLGVLVRMADAAPETAIQYYDQHKDLFLADDYASAERLIKPVRVSVEAGNMIKSAVGSTARMTDPREMANFIIDVQEGGDKLVTDNNGYATRYGINTKFNPGVDLENLSKSDAAMLLVERYYRRAGADDFPANMRLAIFDAAVNQGPENARKWAQEADGDLNKFMQLRAADYDRLNRTGKPEYTNSYASWQRRMANVNRQSTPSVSLEEIKAGVAQQGGGLEATKAAFEMLDQQIKARDDLIKGQEADASRQAYEYLQSNQSVPPSVIARMNPKEVEAMQNRAPTDPAFVQEIRRRVLAGQDVDLAQYRWQLGKDYEELVKAQQNPDAMDTSSIVDDMVKTATPFIVTMGKPTDLANASKLDAFRRAAIAQVDARTRSKGAPLTPQEKQAVVDSLLLTVRRTNVGRFWDSTEDVPAYMAQGSQYTIPGIEPDLQYTIRGNKVSYQDVVDTVFGEAMRRNLRPTSDVMESIFKELSAQGGPINYTTAKE